MNKLQDLRAVLLNSPLNIQPEDLDIRVRNGAVNSWNGGDNTKNNSFICVFDIHILIKDFKHNQTIITHLLCEWAQTNNKNYDFADISFSADIVNNNTVDLEYIIADVYETTHIARATLNGATGYQVNDCELPITNPTLRKQGLVKVDYIA